MHLREVFQVLRDKKLYINIKKSEFFLEEIQYLGHIVSKLGIRMDFEKLEVIQCQGIYMRLEASLVCVYTIIAS